MQELRTISADAVLPKLSSDVTAMIITEVQELHAISVRENLSEGRPGTWSVSVERPVIALKMKQPQRQHSESTSN
jgi:hypothetical protein